MSSVFTVKEIVAFGRLQISPGDDDGETLRVRVIDEKGGVTASCRVYPDELRALVRSATRRAGAPAGKE